jgi:hypothetical protein
MHESKKGKRFLFRFLNAVSESVYEVNMDLDEIDYKKMLYGLKVDSEIEYWFDGEKGNKTKFKNIIPVAQEDIHLAFSLNKLHLNIDKENKFKEVKQSKNEKSESKTIDNLGNRRIIERGERLETRIKTSRTPSKSRYSLRNTEINGSGTTTTSRKRYATKGNCKKGKPVVSSRYN